MTERWIVVQTQPRRELWAAENISRLGYEYYFPKIQTFVGKGHLKIARAEPLFPRHIFVRSDEGQWRSLTGCWGVAGVLMWGNEPGFIPLRELERVRKMEGEDGMVALPERKLTQNSKVRVVGGAFAGFTGVYQGDDAKDRVKVLLDLLGRKTTVLISEGHVEAV